MSARMDRGTERGSPSPGASTNPENAVLLTLPDALVEAVALRVVALLGTEHQQHQDHWLDVDGAAEHLCCPKSRIYRLVSMRRIPYCKDGARLLFERGELDEWVRDGGAQ